MALNKICIEIRLSLVQNVIIIEDAWLEREIVVYACDVV